MKVKIAYYREDREIDIPEKNLIGVLRPKEIQPAEDLTACINQNLDAPIGTEPFDKLCAGKKNICILVCDLTRPMETDRVLPILLDRIERNAPGAKITILIALGTHRGLTDEEIDKLCGPGIREKYSVINHAFDDPNALVQVPCSAEGVPPVFVNKLLTECDLRLAVGAVKPHPILAGPAAQKLSSRESPGMKQRVTATG